MTPYYLRAFEIIIDAFRETSPLRNLLDEREIELLNSFLNELEGTQWGKNCMKSLIHFLLDGARLLLVRLFMRKKGSFRLSKLDYSEIEDLQGAFECLRRFGWVTEEFGLSDMIESLNHSELKSIATWYLHSDCKKMSASDLKKELVKGKPSKQMTFDFKSGSKGFCMKTRTKSDLKLRISNEAGTAKVRCK